LGQEYSKQVWGLLILKILDSRNGGEASTSDIARELAILDSAIRETLPSHHIENGIFGAGFVDIPRRGLWRITERGRDYLRSTRITDRSTEANIELSGDISTHNE
jgi:predicted transcriptional regulator